jgi:ubiquinone/menaquinone biosynthesis C-methylase UbiE
MSENPLTFDGEIPENYDRFLGPTLFEPFAADLAARHVGDGARDVLEVACGTGILTRALLRRIPSTARLVATDLSPDMLDYARKRLVEPGRVEWRQADVAALPFADASFDAVYCQFGLMFAADKVAAASEARRVLRPGGSFVFNVWSRLEE